MSNIAILIGNVEYVGLRRLDCCHNDLVAMHDLLDATGRYSTITVIEDAMADDLKAQIRQSIERHEKHDEIFFYFSGHGLQSETEFYFCATDFDIKRPNETGLSNSELHEFLRSASPELVVKITDACNSGTLLVKGEGGFLPIPKTGLRHVVQIASCLDSQDALVGDMLSPFTEKFCLAALRKNSGPVYYTDIISTLRDDYLSDSLQTPHFVSQGTGREVLIEDATSLKEFRDDFSSKWAPPMAETTVPEIRQIEELTLADLLKNADEKIATPTRISTLVDGLFNGIITNLAVERFTDLFTIERIEHSDFQESTTRAFIIRVLSKEKRSDSFVFADIEKTKKKRSALATAMLSFPALYDDDYIETWNLDLNCEMKRAQLKITLTPKFNSLKRIVLIVTCAPSLEHCYIFELVTQHQLTDFSKYEEYGEEVVRRWYKEPWDEEMEGLSEEIAKRLLDVTQKQVDEVSKRLTAQD